MCALVVAQSCGRGFIKVKSGRFDVIKTVVALCALISFFCALTLESNFTKEIKIPTKLASFGSQSHHPPLVLK